MAHEPPQDSPPARRPRLSASRRAGLLVVGVLATALSLTCTTQIVLAVWFPPVQHDEVSCRGAVLGLLTAVQRAREQAAAEGPQGERAALSVFRSALEPEWDRLPSVRAACSQDAGARSSLRTVELLRYAEERAVRYEALGLSPLRQRALALQQELEQSTPSATTVPPTEHRHEP